MPPIPQMVQSSFFPHPFTEYYSDRIYVYSKGSGELVVTEATPAKAKKKAEDLNKLIRGEAKLQKPKRY